MDIRPSNINIIKVKEAITDRLEVPNDSKIIAPDLHRRCQSALKHRYVMLGITILTNRVLIQYYKKTSNCCYWSLEIIGAHILNNRHIILFNQNYNI